MNTYRFAFLFTVLLAILSQVQGQVITADPEFPTADSAVTITFDATEGSQGLMDYDGDIYAHTGVTTQDGQWQHVIAGWEENIDKAKLERISDNTYEFSISPSIKEFYGAPDNDKISEICLVFRNEDGSQQTNDIFADVYESGLHVTINQPNKKRFVAKKGTGFSFEAAASDADSIELYADDELLHTASGSSLTQTLNFSAEGARWLWVKASSGDETATDSLYAYIRGDVNEAALPAGAHKGINYTGDNSVTLVLHAPGKEFVFAMGSFSDWKLDPDSYMNRTPDGEHFWVTLNGLEPDKEYVYQYFVDSETTIADPYTEKILSPWNDQYISEETYPNLIPYPEEKTEGIASVFQTNPSEYDWEVTDFDPPAKDELVIYELLIRDFTKDGEVGDLHGVMEKLDYLDSLGVNAIELMPVNEFEGNDSWGYNPSFYFAFDKAYGRKQDMQAFVDSAHKRGMAVIVDMVLNHSYGQSPFVRLYFNPDAGEYGQPTADNPWYNQECPHPPYCWGFDFNHQSQATQNLVDSINSFWLEEYNVDGFRFDFTKGFTNSSSSDEGWSYDQQRVDALKRMSSEIWKTNEDAYVMLEHFAANEEEKELTNEGMMVWGNMNHNYNEATMGFNSGDKSDFSWVSYKNREFSTPGLVGYMESHDEERLMFKNLEYGNSSGSYDITELSTALDRIELAANFFIPVPGPKMIWQFGELGYDISIDQNGRVGKKPVKWEYYEQPDRKAVYNVYAALNKLKQEEPAFSSGGFSFRNADAAVKELVITHDDMDVYVIGNFGVEAKTFTPEFSQSGAWYELYSGDSIQTSEIGDIELDPGAYRFYTTKKLDQPQLATGLPQTSRASFTEVKVYPNPVGNTARLQLQMPQGGRATLKLMNMQGKVLMNKELHLQSGSNVKTFNTSALANGMYIITIAGNDIQARSYLMKR